MPVKPNFFIVGAPKCGTTALSTYLKNHPHIFMTTPKEPGYFAEDLPGLRYISTQLEYEHLYRAAQPESLAIGEASPSYMFSKKAISLIREYNSAAKIIVMLRNPLEMLVSYHSQLVFSSFEDQRDFNIAWSLQSERTSGRAIPALCREPGLLQYREMALLGDQLERIFSFFPSNQILVIFYEDFRTDTASVYKSVLDFLAVPHDGRTEFPAVNRAKIARWERLNQLLHSPPAWVMNVIRRISGSRLHDQIVKLHSKLLSWNSINNRPKAVSEGTKVELLQIVRPQIDKLEKLLGRDLSHWTS